MVRVNLPSASGLTQQSLANQIELHVNQIKRYEAGTAQPTLETLVRLDELVFSEDERGPSEGFRMQFEALRQFNEREKLVAKELLDSLILGFQGHPNKFTLNLLNAGLALSQAGPNQILLEISLTELLPNGNYLPPYSDLAANACLGLQHRPLFGPSHLMP